MPAPMFEIGNTLREARQRRGYDLARCEAETKIRAKYLRALEEEQFELLPAATYVRGFLRTYAEFLDLDGQLVLDEYESRFVYTAEGNDHEARPRPARGRPPANGSRGGVGVGGGASRGRGGNGPPRGGGRPARSSEARLLWLAIGGVMAVALLVWLGVGDNGTQRTPIPATPESITAPETAADPLAPTVPEAPRAFRVRLTAIGQFGSDLEIHAVNQSGRVLYQEVLEPGDAIRFPPIRRRLWVRAENPGGLELRIDNRVRRLPESAASFYITRRGVQVIGAG